MIKPDFVLVVDFLGISPTDAQSIRVGPQGCLNHLRHPANVSHIGAIAANEQQPRDTRVGHHGEN